MWMFAVLILCIVFTPVYLDTFQVKNEEDFRSKRQVNALPLIYPYGATYKFIIGLSTPVPNKDNIQFAFAANFQWQYVQFTNISMLSQYYFINTVSREQRDTELLHRRDERLTFYRSLTEMLTVKGMNGHDCVLRAICEAAQYPVEEEGLVGEILHIILTPDYGRTPFDDEDPYWEESMSEFKDAAIAGRQMFSCASIYEGCPEGQGVMELISVLRDEKGMNGHDCVLRAICEAAQYPVEEEGLVGEILHIILTPDYGRTPFDDEDPYWEESMSEFKDAAIAGRQMFSCASIYEGCPEGQGVMELISVLRDEKGMNGHDCVLRAICEAAQYPVEEEGLVGEILHIILTPDYGRTPFDDEDPYWEESMSEFKDAAIAGRQMFSCASIYEGCPEGQGVMELISVLRDE